MIIFSSPYFGWFRKCCANFKKKNHIRISWKCILSSFVKLTASIKRITSIEISLITLSTVNVWENLVFHQINYNELWLWLSWPEKFKTLCNFKFRKMLVNVQFHERQRNLPSLFEIITTHYLNQNSEKLNVRKPDEPRIAIAFKLSKAKQVKKNNKKSHEEHRHISGENRRHLGIKTMMHRYIVRN